MVNRAGIPICDGGIIQGCEQAKINPLSVHADLRSPFPRFSIPMDPLIPTGVIIPNFSVFHVFGMGSCPEIRLQVIHTVTIYMISFEPGRRSSNDAVHLKRDLPASSVPNVSDRVYFPPAYSGCPVEPFDHMHTSGVDCGDVAFCQSDESNVAMNVDLSYFSCHLAGFLPLVWAGEIGVSPPDFYTLERLKEQEVQL